MNNYDYIIFFKTLIKVCSGRHIWRFIVKKNNINTNNDFVILLPRGNNQCNYYVLLYLNKFIENLEKRKNFLQNNGIPIFRRNEKFYILTNDSLIEACANSICRRISKVIKLSDIDINKILYYYKFIPLTDRLIIGELNGVKGREGYYVLNSKGITIEEIVANGIFDFKIDKFNRFTRPRTPIYKGKDKSISNFIELNDMRLSHD